MTIFTEQHFKSVVGRFPTGVTVITSETPTDGKPIGLTISSFHSLSLQPPLILWTLTKKASTLDYFRNSKSYVVHILSAQQKDMALQFASGPQEKRFINTKVTRAPGGSIMLDDNNCAAWLECENITQHEAGDHYIFIGKVKHCEYRTLAPLVYHSGSFELTPKQKTIAGKDSKSIVV